MHILRERSAGTRYSPQRRRRSRQKPRIGDVPMVCTSTSSPPGCGESHRSGRNVVSDGQISRVRIDASGAFDEVSCRSQLILARCDRAHGCAR